MAAPRIGWYGDDFTGATDTLAVLAQAGLRAMLFLGVPGPEALAAAGPLDAVGIAGAARAMPPEAMRAELAPVARFFRQLAPPVLHYKVCSTFDSAPHIGNIACAIHALHPAVDNAWVPIVGGQPSLGRYCAFSHLFAAAGSGGAVHRIDRHPTMRQHPVTPMGEADLRLHLARQGLDGITALHYPLYDAAPGDPDLHTALQALLDRVAMSASAAAMVPTLLDLTAPAQLPTVGRLLWQQARTARLLAVGSSAVAQALVAHWASPAPQAAPVLAPAEGPVFAWAGSLSPLTAAQVQAATDYHRIAVDGHRLGSDPAYEQALQNAICAALASGRHVLAHTGPGGGPDDAAGSPVRAASHVAQASAELIARVIRARATEGAPLRRVGIAGGDTSSHAVQALQLWGLSYQTTLCPGVTLSRAHSTTAPMDGLELMLKGGQMGGVDLFARLLGT